MFDMKAWGLAICGIVIICGIMEMFFIWKRNNIFKLLTGVVILLVILSPLKNLSNMRNSNKEISIPYEYEEKTKITAKNIFLEISAENIKNVIINELLNIDINADKINISIDCDNEYKIIKKDVILIIKNKYKYKENEIKNIIENKLKLPVIIKYSEEK